MMKEPLFKALAPVLVATAAFLNLGSVSHADETQLESIAIGEPIPSIDVNELTDSVDSAAAAALGDELKYPVHPNIDRKPGILTE